MNIGPVSISPFPRSIANETDAVNLRFSVDITPQPLPAGTCIPEFEWFFGQGFNQPLTSTTTNSGSTYTSTYSIASVSESNEGIYTCRLRGNQRTAVSTFLHVGGKPSL